MSDIQFLNVDLEIESKQDIAQLVLAKVEQQDWRYLLDESDFEEQLFAEFGQEVVVENEHLVFKFHLDE